MFTCEADYEAEIQQGAFGSWRASESSVSLIWICEYLDETFLVLFYYLLA